MSSDLEAMNRIVQAAVEAAATQISVKNESLRDSCEAAMDRTGVPKEHQGFVEDLATRLIFFGVSFVRHAPKDGPPTFQPQ